MTQKAFEKWEKYEKEENSIAVESNSNCRTMKNLLSTKCKTDKKVMETLIAKIRSSSQYCKNHLMMLMKNLNYWHIRGMRTAWQISHKLLKYFTARVVINYFNGNLS